MRISDWSSDVCSSDLSGHRMQSGRWMKAGPIIPARAWFTRKGMRHLFSRERSLVDHPHGIDLDLGRAVAARIHLADNFDFGFFVDGLAGEILIVDLRHDLAGSIRECIFLVPGFFQYMTLKLHVIFVDRSFQKGIPVFRAGSTAWPCITRMNGKGEKGGNQSAGQYMPYSGMH